MSSFAKQRKKKHKASLASASCELNVMPFIDIFSLLCTFLLFSAVFISIGVVEVQIPFLTNAAPSKSDEKKTNEKSIDLQMSINQNQIELTVKWSHEEDKKEVFTFTSDKKGQSELHDKLLETKRMDPKTDKITLFIDDEVAYEAIINILDQIKIKNISKKDTKKKNAKDTSSQDDELYPKVIFGSVIL